MCRCVRFVEIVIGKCLGTACARVNILYVKCV